MQLTYEKERAGKAWAAEHGLPVDWYVKTYKRERKRLREAEAEKHKAKKMKTADEEESETDEESPAGELINRFIRDTSSSHFVQFGV